MRSGFLTIVAAAVPASAAGFYLHVFSAEWVQRFVSALMEGKTVAPSWDVRVPAAISSIEIGLGAAFCYWLLRHRFPHMGWVRGGLLLAGLVLMIKGNLVRQPVMNLLVGNPVEVVAIQDGLTWLTWGLMGWIIALVFALAERRQRAAQPLKDRTV